MKNLRYVLFSLTVLLMTTAAQAQQTYVKAHVPFDFVVGDRAYPAGDYAIKSASIGGIIISIYNTQERARAFTRSDNCAGNALPARSELVFHRLGGSYFLYQVSTESGVCRELSTSRGETQLAKKLEKPEPVIVAAKISR
jgi:hypothetical protein